MTRVELSRIRGSSRFSGRENIPFESTSNLNELGRIFRNGPSTSAPCSSPQIFAQTAPLGGNFKLFFFSKIPPQFLKYIYLYDRRILLEF